ncbi:MAG: AAA family ATPase [Bacteroidales bacterium]|jgi:tetratricopeptide (TPR) repeat protein|nr:AAA family ATPase [Bacteroidales bacterium]MDD4215193.1 AAA family ATPase [Bacteroidales bacterium]
MKTITFYSYKGGVGRTLALANIAKRLSEFGKKVCLIDFDLEAPGLHHKFKENIGIKGINQGLVDYINYFNCHNSTPKSLTNYITPIVFKNKKYKDIDFIPAGNVYSDEYWKTLFSIDWINMFYKKGSHGVALFVDLKERIKKELKPDYLLIDSRTGISEISGITMSLMADEIVLFAAKNGENLQGIKQIIKTLAQPENTLSGKLPKLNFVLCRIPYFERPDEKNIEQRAINEVNRDLKSFILDSKLSFNFEKLFIIHSDPTLEIEEKLLMAYQYEKEEENKQYAQRKFRIKSPIASDYLELFEELTKGKLSDKEKYIFNNIKKAEFLIERVQNTPDNNKKNELLVEAISLNPESNEAFYLLAKNYYINDNYCDALKNIEIAIELNPDSNEYLGLKGNILKEKSKIKEAKQIFNDILFQDKKNFNALASLGGIYIDEKKYKKALEYYLKVVEYYPDYSGGYNNVGNTYRLQKKYDKAFEYIYKALEINPRDSYSTGTLGEIYAQQGNVNEFYKNFELSISFGMSKAEIERIFKIEDVYKPYFKEQKFINILKKYNIDIDISKFI